MIHASLSEVKINCMRCDTAAASLDKTWHFAYAEVGRLARTKELDHAVRGKAQAV